MIVWGANPISIVFAQTRDEPGFSATLSVPGFPVFWTGLTSIGLWAGLSLKTGAQKYVAVLPTCSPG